MLQHDFVCFACSNRGIQQPGGGRVVGEVAVLAEICAEVGGQAERSELVSDCREPPLNPHRILRSVSGPTKI